ncbi:ABC transporter transmembrane domain-containing protein [Buchnera aphidicola (Taiwanaphis decaspermi)]|uniref:ABC transporter transmembrane domain-containing protein n=1 Tax=Buchnera aphidicola TaxID=9 RepID=UPI0031B7F4BF
MNHSITCYSILKRLFFYWNPFKKSLIIAIMMLFFSSMAESCCPIIISYFINIILIKKKIHLIISIIVSFIFIILQIISIVFNYLQSILFNKISTKVLKKIRFDVMKSILNQPLNKFDDTSVGKIISRVTNDTEIIKDLYENVISNLLRSLSIILTVLFSMFLLEWKLALITSTIIPIVIIIMIIYHKYSSPFLRKTRIYLANINSYFNEIIVGMNVIQQFNQQKRFGKLIFNASILHYKSRIKNLNIDGLLLRPLISFISSIMLLCLISLFALSILGALKVGIIYAFISYTSRLNEPLTNTITQQSIVEQSIIAAERIFKIIDLPNQKYGYYKNIKYGIIKIKNLNFYYKKKQRVLKNINIYCKKNSFTAFVGKSGSGKSTLINLLMNFYPISEGKIYIDNRPIESFRKESLRKEISLVQQDPIIFADTFLSNITLGRNISISRVWDIIQKVKLKNLVESMKNGIYTLLREQGNNLSAGQKQLLSLARSLIGNPKILILDEATSSIDSEAEQNIQKIISYIRKNTTLLIVAHRLSTITKADNIFVLNKGKIIESGNHKNLLKNKGYYWNMHEFQKYNSFI